MKSYPIDSAFCAYSRTTAGSPPMSPSGNKAPSCMIQLPIFETAVASFHKWGDQSGIILLYVVHPIGDPGNGHCPSKRDKQSLGSRIGAGQPALVIGRC